LLAVGSDMPLFYRDIGAAVIILLFAAVSVILHVVRTKKYTLPAIVVVRQVVLLAAVIVLLFAHRIIRSRHTGPVWTIAEILLVLSGTYYIIVYLVCTAEEMKLGKSCRLGDQKELHPRWVLAALVALGVLWLWLDLQRSGLS